MTSLVSSWDTHGLQSHSIRNLVQSLWRKCRVAPMRSRSFILLGPYWTVDDSSLVKESLWNTGGALLKYFAANLTDRKREIGWMWCTWMLAKVPALIYTGTSYFSYSSPTSKVQGSQEIVDISSIVTINTEHFLFTVDKNRVYSRYCIRADAE